MELANGNLLIRQATIVDDQCLCNWWSNGDIMDHAGFPNGVNTDINQLIKRIEKNSESSKRLIIEIDSIPVGEMNYNIDNNIAEIGIKICELKYQEKGFGTKVLKMLIKYLFEELKVDKIILDTNLKNARAQHVYEKIGFKKINVRIDSWINQIGEIQSSVDYELLSDEFMLD